MALAGSQMLARCWVEKRRAQITAGVFWALSYLTKAVAFPLAIGICLAVASIKCLVGTARPRLILHSLAVTLLAFLQASLDHKLAIVPAPNSRNQPRSHLVFVPHHFGDEMRVHSPQTLRDATEKVHVQPAGRELEDVLESALVHARE